MNIELLKKLGNVEQLAGIREAQLLRGRGQGIQVAGHNRHQGLTFTGLHFSDPSLMENDTA